MQSPESNPTNPAGHRAGDEKSASAETEMSAPPAHEHAGHTPVHARRGTGGRMLVAAIVLAGGLLGGFLLVNHRRSEAASALQHQATESADSPLTVDVVKVQYGSLSRRVPLPGECHAWYQTTLYARVNGYVKKWFVDIGDKVKEGQVLATIETPELDQQLTANLAKVEACKAQINLAQANVHFSDVTLARFKDAPRGVVSDLERDEKAADYQISQAKLTAAKSDLNSAQAEVDRLRAMIAFQKVVAPFDGIITQRRVDIGELVTAGSSPSTTPLFTIAQSDTIRVFVHVPESAAPEIRDGARAVATSDEFPGEQFVGHVTRSSHAINDTSKTLRVEVDIPNRHTRLLPGMFVRVNFEFQGAQPMLVIPASAINFRSGGPQVATVSSDGHVEFHPVTIARDLGDSIEISGGVRLDDRVALNISSQIAAGDIVKPTEVAEPPAPASPPPAPAHADSPPDATKRISLNSH